MRMMRMITILIKARLRISDISEEAGEDKDDAIEDDVEDEDVDIEDDDEDGDKDDGEDEDEGGVVEGAGPPERDVLGPLGELGEGGARALLHPVSLGGTTGGGG